MRISDDGKNDGDGAAHVPADQLRGMTRFYSPLVSDVMDSLGLPSGVLDSRMQAMCFEPNLKVCGRAFPCRVVPTDDYVEITTLLEMVDAIPKDAFVLVASDAPIDAALWGGLMSARAGSRGAVGAAVNGGVRDVAQIVPIGFPVFAEGRCIKDIRRRGYMHSYNVSIEMYGVTINPGDVIFGDINGVVSIPASQFQTVYAELERALGEESETQKGLLSGGAARDLFERHGRF